MWDRTVSQRSQGERNGKGKEGARSVAQKDDLLCLIRSRNNEATIHEIHCSVWTFDATVIPVADSSSDNTIRSRARRVGDYA